MDQIPSGAPVLKIKDVAEATGISVDNLRAWERRHGYPVPVRTPGGQRLYSPEQVRKLSEVRELLRRGMRVGQAIAEYLAPLREKRKALEAKPGAVEDVIHAGDAKARHAAAETMAEVRERMHIG